MKKVVTIYAIISTILISGTFLPAVSLSIARNDIHYKNITNYKQYNEILYDNTELDFQSTLVALENYNSSVVLRKVQAITNSTNHPGGLVTIGSIKNATNDEHAMLACYTFTKFANGSVLPINIGSYRDQNTVNETNYLQIVTTETNFDSSVDKSAIYALKSINQSVYAIDVFFADASNLTFNTSLEISSERITEVTGFTILDIDNDDTYECYVIGHNGTDPARDFCIVEYQYNQSNNSIFYSDSFSWSVDDNFEIATINTIREDISGQTYFLVGYINSTTTIESYLQTISLENDVIRDFTAEGEPYKINIPNGNFRLYNCKLLSLQAVANPELVLFGQYFDLSVTSLPVCIKLNFASGSISNQRTYIKDVSFDGMISFDGIIIDLDLDHTEDIVMSSFDILGVITTRLQVLAETPDLSERYFQAIDLKTVSSCGSVYLSSSQMAFYVGQKYDGSYSIRVHQMEYLPFEIHSSGKHFVEDSTNRLRIVPLSLEGAEIIRNDFQVAMRMPDSMTNNATGDSFPGFISLNTSEITTPQFFTVELFVESKETDYSLVKTFDVYVSYEFAIDLFVPQSPFVLREPNYATKPITLVVSNYKDIESSCNATLRSARFYNQETYSFFVPANTRVRKEMILNLDIMAGKDETNDQFYVEIETLTGNYNLYFNVDLTSQGILPSDLYIASAITFLIVLLGFIVIAFLAFRSTKKAIDRYISEDKPLAIEFDNFKKRAVIGLLDDYEQKGAWEKGLRLTKELETGTKAPLGGALNENIVSTKKRTFLQLQARDLLQKGQELIAQGELLKGEHFWSEANELLTEIGVNRYLDIFSWYYEPIKRIISAKKSKKGEEQANALLKEFQNINNIKEQEAQILGINITIPIWVVAEELATAFKEANDLQQSLSYLQIAYQDAPDREKNRIVTEITGLISLGVTPSEMVMPVNQKAIQERLAQRSIRCFSCGKERINLDEKCPNCDSETIKCSVCKLPISFESTWAKCPKCDHLAHKEHLQEWVKVKGTCPVCKEKIKPDDLIVQET
jgi:hypothetical protein